MSTTFPRIGVLIGSTRQGSLNQALAQHAAALSPVDLTVVEGIYALPHFSQELEADAPQSVADLRGAVAGLDALLLVTPEYNASMPGVVKNAIDWLSRPYDASVLAGLPVAVIGASPGRGGASGAVGDAVRVLQRAGAAPLEATVTVPRAHAVLGQQLEDELKDRLGALLDELISAAEARATNAA
ncbi:MAG: NAD(P)H-dependent oxidoreductase [Propionibacteriaceae bacterium]|nr:NAD(P)H-dependent oxidoreductase [Propionibacteriaceae bacterium]